MVTVGTLVGLGLIVGLHTLFAAVATRFFRVQLKTDWGTVVYALTVTPVVLLMSTLILSGALAIGGDVGNRGAALFLTVLVPMTLGFAFDLFWMPHPDEVELPDTAES
jgi:hypothetical protein